MFQNGKGVEYFFCFILQFQFFCVHLQTDCRGLGVPQALNIIMTMNRFLSLFTALACSLCLTAQTALEDFKRDITLAGDNYVAYRAPEKALTAAPRGYKACYISHYGRHGSRNLIGDRTYEHPYSILKKADEAGMLTPQGRGLMEKLRIAKDDAAGHIEELTLRGAQQHAEIATRMYDRFPTVFKGKVNVKANSSTVVRCILSMNNALLALQRRNPEINFRFDASKADMNYIIFDDKPLFKQRMPEGSEARKAYHEYERRHIDYVPFMNRLFRSEQYWRWNVKNPQQFYVDEVWKICSNMQSSELRHSLSLYEYFTFDELYNIWLARNANWYITYGPSPLNGGTQPFSQRRLLRKMIEEADSALALPVPGANLRYGHEVCVLPLVCLLDLDGYGTQYASLDDVERNGWRDYNIFMMGSNVQFVFYRKDAKDSEPLVKVLLNENETTLPKELKPVTGPYYKWSDVRAHYLKKINDYESKAAQ